MPQAIAGGRTRSNAIAQAVGLERTAVSKYLATLRDLGYVERRVPVTDTRPSTSRKGISVVADPLVRFWFRFIGSVRAALGTGNTAAAAARVEEQLPQFAGQTFEELCSEWVAEQWADGLLEFSCERIGGWWDRDHAIDVVAVGQRDLLVGECKWTPRQVGVSTLSDLRHNAAPLLSGLPDLTPHYALFSRAGFTPELVDMAAAESLILVSADELLA